MPGRVESAREGAIGWIVFDPPERRNAISPHMWSELSAVARACSRDDASFSIPAARLGVGCGLAALETLASVVGLPMAKEVLFSAHRYCAADALRMGLVNEVMPKAELEAGVREIAGRIAEGVKAFPESASPSSRDTERFRQADSERSEGVTGERPVSRT